jgi:hypothetical protein
MAHWLTRKFLAYLNRKKGSRSELRIATGAEGIRLAPASGPVSVIPWERISRVVAFKRDLYSHDLLCLLIEHDGKSVTEVSEDMPGFTELARELPQHLPSAKPYAHWFAEAAFPAFKTSSTNVFLR